MPQRRAEIRIASWPRADRASSERPLGARPLDPRSRTVDGRPFMPPAVACPLPRPMPRPRLLHWPRARACNVPSASSRFEREDVSRLAETNLAVQFQRPQPRADDTPDRGAHFPHGAADRSPLLLRAPAANKKRLTPRSGVYRADRLWTGRPCCRTLWDFLAQVKINPHLPQSSGQRTVPVDDAGMGSPGQTSTVFPRGSRGAEHCSELVADSLNPRTGAGRPACASTGKQRDRGLVMRIFIQS